MLILKAAELGLSNDIIAVSTKHPSARNRYIYVNRKLHQLPNGGRFSNDLNISGII